MKHEWIIFETRSGSDQTYRLGPFSTKRSAEKRCRDDGFRYRVKTGYFIKPGILVYRYIKKRKKEE